MNKFKKGFTLVRTRERNLVSGFTLIELLVGLAVMTAIFILASSLVIDILDKNLKSEKKQIIEQVKNDLQAEVSNSVRWANNISFIGGVFEVDDSKYHLDYTDNRLYKNGVPFTPMDVVISRFEVERFSSPVSTTELGNGTGLIAEYYDERNFGEPVFTQVDIDVDYDWGLESPSSLIDPNTFSIRWKGQLEIPTSGNYTFYTVSDDGARLWIDNKIVINSWRDQSATERRGSLELQGNKRYDLRLDYYENFGRAVARLLWSSSEIPKGVIPTSRFYPEEPFANLQIEVDMSYRNDPNQQESIKYLVSPRGGVVGAIEEAPVDVCPNIDGLQTKVPEGYVKHDGECALAPPPIDLCPNISGVQNPVPAGKIVDVDGNCVDAPPTDLCPNLDGVQESVPGGYIKSGGVCVPAVDVCPNISGVQVTIPGGMVKEDSGNCVSAPPSDQCANIAGVQETVPAGYIKQGVNCIEEPKPAR